MIDARHWSWRYDLYGRFTGAVAYYSSIYIAYPTTGKRKRTRWLAVREKLSTTRNDILYGRFTGGDCHRESRRRDAAAIALVAAAIAANNASGKSTRAHINAGGRVHTCTYVARTSVGVDFRRAATVGNT